MIIIVNLYLSKILNFKLLFIVTARPGLNRWNQILKNNQKSLEEDEFPLFHPELEETILDIKEKIKEEKQNTSKFLEKFIVELEPEIIEQEEIASKSLENEQIKLIKIPNPLGIYERINEQILHLRMFLKSKNLLDENKQKTKLELEKDRIEGILYENFLYESERIRNQKEGIFF